MFVKKHRRRHTESVGRAHMLIQSYFSCLILHAHNTHTESYCKVCSTLKYNNNNIYRCVVQRRHPAPSSHGLQNTPFEHGRAAAAARFRSLINMLSERTLLLCIFSLLLRIYDDKHILVANNYFAHVIFSAHLSIRIIIFILILLRYFFSRINMVFFFDL